ncbi:MAG: glycosyltransferase family 8 protein [Clostridia bacterium]|nr:glycosyltransferase family 8 protein [Clostridia bacterium]
MKHTVHVAFITDNNFVMQTATAIRSLVDAKSPDTEYDIRVVTADCSEESSAVLSAIEGVTVVRASLDAYRDIRQLAHIPIACLLKFDLCELLPDCDKLLYLDGDILVREDLSPLYETDLEGHILGAVAQHVLIGTDDRKFSAGVLLFDAKRMRDEKVRDKLVETRRALGEQRSMDQQSFNLLYGGNYLELPPRYNCCPMQLRDAAAKGMDRVNAYYGTAYASVDDMLNDGAIVHFATGQKPWLYENIDYAWEWYASYARTAFGGTKLTRKHYTVWISRFNGLKQAKKTGGWKGVCTFLMNAFRKKVLHREIKNDWG